MATMVVERADKRELQTQLTVLNGKIQSAQLEVRNWQSKLDSENAKLAELREEYSVACRAIAKGETGDPEEIQVRMRTVESRITGLKELVAAETATLATLRGKLQAPQQALNALEQIDAERREAEDVSAAFERAKQILARRDAAQTDLNNAVAALRNGNYVSARNRSDAKNHAVQIERLEIGIIS